MSRPIPPWVGFIDLETLPGDAFVGMPLDRAPGWEPPEVESEESIRARAPKSYTGKRLETWVQSAMDKAAQVPEDEQAAALEHWRKASVDPYRGRIALITWAFGEEETIVIDCAEDEEAGLQTLAHQVFRWRAWLAAEWGAHTSRRWPGHTFVAHNGYGFDFPYLQLRALAAGSTALASRFHQDKKWDGRLVDTLEWWPTTGGWSNRFHGTKLDDICAFLRIPRPANPISGAEVLDAYVRGDWDQVVAHGVADVRDLREVYRVLREVRGGE